MRISCEVEISDRRIPSLSMKRQARRGSRASVAIGHLHGMTKSDPCSLHFLVSTALNRAGVKYRVHKNLLRTFTKFISNGQATIQFEDPPHDIYIRKADPIQLRGFLKVMENTNESRGGVAIGWLTPATTSELEAPKTSLVISERAKYPTFEGFPSTLVVLGLKNCSLKKIDTRILHLKRLQNLDLGNNALTTLPNDTRKLLGGTLRILNLSHNRLKTIPSGMFSGSVPNLVELDLSHNQIVSLPSEICSVQSLKCLKLDHNRISRIPDNIWMLINLTELSVASNALSKLPGGIFHLSLQTLDVSNNPFTTHIEPDERGGGALGTDCNVPDLLELAARTILAHRFTVSAVDVPPNLVSYMSSPNKCLCGIRFVRSSVEATVRMDLKMTSLCLSVDDNGWGRFAPVHFTFCSQACLRQKAASGYD